MSKYISPFKGATRIKLEEPKRFINAYSLPKKKNQGGIPGAIGYLGGNVVTGAGQMVEGIVDVGMAGADLLRGDTDMAQYRFIKNVTKEWDEELERSYNPGTVMQIGGDVASGIGTSLMYMIPKAGIFLGAAGTFGSNVSEAAERTGEVGLKELGYAAAATVPEVALEGLLGAATRGGKALFSAGSKALTKGTAKAGVNAVGKSATKASKSLLGHVALETAKGMAGEGAEEAITEAIDPFLLRLFKIDENAQLDMGNVVYAGLIGSLSGGLMTSGPAAINYKSSQAAGRMIREAGLTDAFLEETRELLGGADRAKAKAETAKGEKVNAEEGSGVIGKVKAFGQNVVTSGKQRKIASSAAKIAETTRKNLRSFEELNAKENKTAHEQSVADAMLGELRGNVYLLETAYLSETYEQAILDATPEQKQDIVDFINKSMAAKNATKSDYTVADLDADTDGILTSMAAKYVEGDLERYMGIRRVDTMEGRGRKATETAEEAAQGTKETTTEEVDAQEENAATEDLSGIEEEVWRAVTDETVKGYGTQNEQEVALLRAAVSHGVPEKSIPLMLERFREGTDMTPAEFADAWADGVLFFGRLGLNEKKISQESTLSRMSEKARRTSIEYGKYLSEEQRSKEQEAAKKKKRPVKEGASKKPKGEVVRHPGINLKEDLDDAQFTAYKAAEIMAPALKADIEIHKELKRDGKEVNGYYDLKTNTIHININAVRDGKHIALYTLGHEVTHYIKAWSPKKFYELGDYVMDQLGEGAEKAVRDKLDFLKRNDLVKGLDETEAYDRAYEEVVADGMELVLTDGTVLNELARENKTLWQKIKDRIFEIIEKIKKAYNDLSKTSRTAQILKETMDSLDEIEQLFYEGVREAGERTRTAGVETLTRMNEGKMHDGKKVYSSAGKNADVRFEVKRSNGSVISVNTEAMTNEQILDLMKMARNRLLDDNTYFPIKKHTPSRLIEILRHNGIAVDDKPIVMQAKKAKQSQIDGKKVKYRGKTIRYHGLQASEIIEAIDRIEFPVDVIYQTNRTKTITDNDGETETISMPDNFSVFVEISNGKKCVVVIEFNSFIDSTSEESAQHTTVTVFESDTVREGLPFDYAEYLLSNESNIEMDLDIETNKENPSSEAVYGEPLATTSEKEFSKDSIPQGDQSVNRKFSTSEENSSDTAYLAAVERGDMVTAQKMVDEAAKKAGVETGTTTGDKKMSFESEDRITVNMNEEMRARILRNKTITPPEIIIPEKFDVNREDLELNRKSAVEKPLIKKLREMGYLTEYQTNAIDVSFDFTAAGLRKSMNSQVNDYGGSLGDLAKVVMNMQALLDSSVLIEIHSDKGKGTPRENPQLVQTFVLMSAFREGTTITPVQFEVKQFVDNDNRLYLAVALTKIETGVMDDTITDRNRISTRLLPVSDISIPQFIQKINPRDEKFFKYIPDDFLSAEQKESKRRAIAKDEAKYGRKYSVEITDIRYSIDETTEIPDVSEKPFEEAVRRANLSHLLEGNTDSATAEAERSNAKAILFTGSDEMRRQLIQDHIALANAMMSEARNQDEYETAKNYRAKAEELSDLEVNLVGLRKMTYALNKDIDALREKAKKYDDETRPEWLKRELERSQAQKTVWLAEMDALKEKISDEKHKLLAITAAHPFGNLIAEYVKTADAMVRSAERTKQREAERIKAIREESRKAVYKAKRDATEYKNAVYRKAYEKANAKVAKAKDEYKQREQYKSDRREVTTRKRAAQRILGSLNTALYSPTKAKHVPLQLHDLVETTLKSADPKQFGINRDHIREMSDLAGKIERLERKVALTGEEQETLNKMKGRYEHLEADTISVKRQAEALNTAFKQYQLRVTEADMMDKDLMDALDGYVAEIEEATLAEMNLKSLIAVEKFYTVLLHQVNNSNKTFATEKAVAIDKLGTDANTEVKEVKALKFLQPRAMELAGLAGVRGFFWNNMKPLTVFDAIGSKTFAKLFKNVMDGEDVWATDLEEAHKFLQKNKKEFGYDKWDLKKRSEITTADGTKVALTLGEKMSLYAYMFREQAEEHLSIGGFTFAPDAKTVAAYKDGAIKYEAVLNDQKQYHMRKEDIVKMAESLTEEQRAYAEAVQKYLTSLGKKGNEVSVKLYGLELFNETAYFPIKSNRDYLAASTGKSGDPNIKSRGTFKETVPDASNPIVLEDFMEVTTNHINTMATYHAFVLPIEDLTRVWNYTPVNIKRDENGEAILDENGMPVADTDGAAGYNSLKAEITKKYGTEANDYIQQLIRDLNGGARRDAAATILDKGLTAFKRAATTMSASTIIQQPTSVIRAMAYVDAKHFSGASFTPWETVKKYAKVAFIKEMGGHDINTGARTQEFLNQREYDNIGQKVKAAVTPEVYGGDPQARAEFFGWLTSKADEKTWCLLFGAVVNEQAERLGKPKDSEEVQKAAGERFTEVVRRTQVYDSTLTRSQYMRSKDGLMKMATSFMAEPTTVVSMAADAIIRLERGDKMFFRRTAAGIAGSIILNAMAVSLVYAMRDDDEEKNYLEKYISSLTGEIWEGFNPLEYFPILRDIMSLFKGYEIERSDMTLINNLMEQVEMITSSKRSFMDKMIGVTGAVAAFFGIPVTNLYRDVKGLTTTTISLFNGEPLTAKGTASAALEGVTDQFGLFKKLLGGDRGTSYELYRAKVSGDKSHYTRVAARYDSPDAEEQALRRELRENDKRIGEAAQARMSGDLEVYKSLVEQIASEGVFDRGMVIRAVQTEMNALSRELEKGTVVPKDTTVTDEETEEVVSLYTSSDLNAALERGDTEDFKEIYESMVSDRVQAGKTEAQAKSAVKSSITAYWKPRYIEARNANDTETMKRILQILLASGLYSSRNDVATLLEGWIKASAKSK